MSLVQVTEYQVQIFRYKTNQRERWKAQAIAFPQFMVEGNSREAVLDEIKVQLAKLEAESEIVKIPIQPAQDKRSESAAPIDEDIAAKLKAMGYEHFGIFADDPGAAEVFDEIERLRDQHTVGG